MPWKQGLVQSETRWRTADWVYVLQNFGFSGSTVFTFEHGQPYVYVNFGSTQDLAPLRSDIPHKQIGQYCNNPPEGAPLYSPDGQLYMQLSSGKNAHVLIYRRDGTLVAEAAKTGWAPRVMGWAHDSSGVYFQLLISGGAASMLVPYEPIFKLSPLTPEEARWAPVWTVGPWALGIAVVAGVGGWWWRRRRRT